MSDIENRVIGGPHHGQYHDFPGQDYIRLPIRIPLPATISASELNRILPVIHDQGYHRRRFSGGSVWVPDSVPEGKVMEHVLRLALKAKP